MTAGLGRINGPLLASNLLRKGVDLAFHNDSTSDNFLYLAVNDGKVGIKTNGPTQQLTINGTSKTTNLIVDTQTEVLPNFSITTNLIQHLTDKIYIQPDQSSDPKIVTTRIGTLNLRVSDKLIENITNNSDINLSPDGTGKVIFDTTVLNITGNLHSTNNITANGNVVIGSNDEDTTFFNSDIKSDLLPDITNTYNLGSSGKAWDTLYSHNVNLTSITSTGFTANDIDLLLTRGNTYFVSVNGSDTNYGNHLHSTFRSVKHALSVAQSGDQIFIFSGTYTEEFPLTVPQGVSVSGESIRSVTISPTVATISKDAFLLNGESIVENISIKGFLFDSINNTGYGFRFANNATVTTRSPYVRNCSVLNQGSVTSLADPLGFDSGDSGRGALVDGSVVQSTSKEAAILFHSVTLIVPNADAIIATNGARVEWLNSFTYYANRGIHLTEGTLGFASLGVKFGAEMRSINSANVYGNYGAVADGASTLGYLIGHNFGYIGTGSNSYNDQKLVIQANEVEELNNGRIYYDSVDHKGDYRIGNIFYVSQETGNVIFDASAIDFGSEGSIVLEGPNGGTLIDNTLVQTGNIRVHDNNIDSLSGPTNFFAASGKTYLNTHVFVTGNAGVTGDVLVKGDFQLGNQTSDVIIIAPELSQDINPGLNNTYEFGTSTRRWNTLYNTLLDVDGVTQITNNTLSTLTTGTDLQLISAGTGILHVPSNSVAIDNSLTIGGVFTVHGSSSVKNTEILGDVTLLGNINQTGNANITGTYSGIDFKIVGNSYFLVPNIKIYGNTISAKQADDDLVFNGATTGGVVLDQRIKITDNTISNVWGSATTETQKSIILSPNGTGNVELSSNRTLILPLGNDVARTMHLTGEIRYNSDYNAFEGWTGTKKTSFNNIHDTTSNTYITPELTPGTNDNIIRFGVNGVVKATVTSSRLYTNTLHIDDIGISGNAFSNLISSNDFELAVSGNGVVNINDTHLVSDYIVNTKDTALILESTGIGYVKFAGNKAMVIPYGPTEDRRATPEIGEIRNNSTLGYLEVYSGDPLQGDNGWIPSTGVSGSATLAVVEDLMDLWSLVLG